MTKERCYKSNGRSASPQAGGILLCTLERGHIGFHHYHIYDDPTKCMAVWDDNGMTLKGVLNYDGPRKNACWVHIEPQIFPKTIQQAKKPVAGVDCQ